MALGSRRLLFSPGLEPWSRWIVGLCGASWGPQRAKGVHTVAKGPGSVACCHLSPEDKVYRHELILKPG